MHIPVDFYVKVPVNLFRRGGETKPRFDYIRTTPPRQIAQKYDLKVNVVAGKTMIDHTSGGLSLFNRPDLSGGSDWWVIPKGTNLPHGFVLSKDLTNGEFRGHYSIRATEDMDLDRWKSILGEWANQYAIHLSKVSGNGKIRHV